MKVVYSFNKKGTEADFWAREIAAASDERATFIPFNHDPYLDVKRYWRAQLLDNLYYKRSPGLARMYADLQAVLERTGADVLLVDNCHPYHPEYLRTLAQYKVLRVNDGPMSAYDRDFAYLHAYDHILYHSPAYSRDLTMPDKLDYCGAKRHDWWPLALFDAGFDPTLTEAELFAVKRDIDVVFIGAFTPGKMPALACIKKRFGRRCVMHGLINVRKNVYFNLMHGFPGWITPISGYRFAPLYRRAKIGFNIHNRGQYTTGNYRMFELPANGVMQISDGGEHLARFFAPGSEVVAGDEIQDVIDKIDYFLAHDAERKDIAVAGYRAVINRHRFRTRMTELVEILMRGMAAEALPS